MEKIDYKNYDNLKLFVKKNKLDEIINYYNLLGWKLYHKEDNKKYEDLINLSLIRPHKIENKDQLQLLQVHLDETLNEQAKAKKHKHSLSTSLALFFGPLGFTFLALGILSALKVLNLFSFVVSIVVGCIGILSLVLGIIFVPKIVKKENIKYTKLDATYKQNLKEICEKITSLTGDNNE